MLDHCMQEETAMDWQIAVRPRQEVLGGPENAALFAASSECWQTCSSCDSGDRDHPVVLSANLAASSCVSFSANEISSSRRDSKSTSERPSCNTPTQVRELRTQEDVFISPDLLADYLEITADARFIGSSNEQQQQDSTRSPTQDFWDTIHQSTISEVAEAAGSSATSVAPSTTCSSPQMSAAASIRRKRWGRDKDDEHRRFHKRPRDNSNSPPAEKSVKFACPYRKHNPAKYGIHESRICALSYWSSISRVKEHLYRCHRAPIHCERCGNRFKTSRDLNSHRINVIDCPFRAVELSEAITPAVEAALKSRKKSYPDQTKEDRWKDIYGILFPNELVPSPYFEPVQEEPAHLLGEYEEYSRQELPKLFRSLLETHFATVQPGSRTWKNDLVSTVEFCHERILAEFRSKCATDPTTTTSPTTPKPASTTTPACASTSSSATARLPSLDASLDHSLYSFIGSTTDTEPTSHNGIWSPSSASAHIDPSILSHNFDFISDYPFWEEDGSLP